MAATPYIIIYLLFCNPGGPGNTEAAQSHIDRFTASYRHYMHQRADYRGQYFVEEKKCDAALKKEAYFGWGLFSYPAYLSLKKKHALHSFAAVTLKQGQTYYLVGHGATKKDWTKLAMLPQAINPDQSYVDTHLLKKRYGGPLPFHKRPLRLLRKLQRKQVPAVLIDETTYLFAKKKGLLKGAPIATFTTKHPSWILASKVHMSKKEVQKRLNALKHICKEDQGNHCAQFQLGDLTPYNK